MVLPRVYSHARATRYTWSQYSLQEVTASLVDWSQRNKFQLKFNPSKCKEFKRNQPNFPPIIINGDIFIEQRNCRSLVYLSQGYPGSFLLAISLHGRRFLKSGKNGRKSLVDTGHVIC
jgi:hypothetical protein